VILLGTTRKAKKMAERSISAKIMNKEEKEWYDFGFSDAKSYPKDHPEQLYQEAWNYFLTDVEDSIMSFPRLVQLFPFYKKGVLNATKFYN
jgi:hypothetical protein